MVSISFLPLSALRGWRVPHKTALVPCFYSNKCALTRPETPNCNPTVKAALIERLLHVGEDLQAKHTSKAGFPPDLKAIQLHVRKPVKSIMCNFLVLLHQMRIYLYMCIYMCLLPNNSLVTPMRGKGTKHTEIGKRKAGPFALLLVCNTASRTEIFGNLDLHRTSPAKASSCCRVEMAASLNHLQASTMQQVQISCL